MPVFGKSLFETVLDGMEVEEEPDVEEIRAYAPRVIAPFLAETVTSDRDEPRSLSDLYGDFALEDRLDATLDAPVPEGPPEWLERLSDDDVAGDLALLPGMTGADIRMRRRQFARQNHPDRVAEPYRGAAHVRMTAANRLVERALREVQRSGSLP
jgi:hypothetical protein